MEIRTQEKDLPALSKALEILFSSEELAGRKNRLSITTEERAGQLTRCFKETGSYGIKREILEKIE